MKIWVIFIFVLYLECIHSACVLTCPGICYVNDDSGSSECELLIDREKLELGGLAINSGTAELKLNLSETVTKIKFAFIQGQSNPLVLSLTSQDSMGLRTVILNGPLGFSSNQFFRPYPNLESAKLGGSVVTDYPTFRFNHKLVTLECEGITANPNAITAGFFSFIDTLVTIIFDCDSRIEAGSSEAFQGLTALTKLDLNRVDLSGALANTFAPLSAVKTVSLRNAKLTNLDSLSTRAQIESLNLETNNLNGTQFSGFQKLTWLNLKANKFAFLDGTHFQGTPLLKYLDLSSNQIHTIANDTFGNTKLETVKVVDNQLTQLDYNVLAPLVSLKLFALDGNQMVCDCRLHWVNLFHDKFQVNFSTSTNNKCHSPAASSGRAIISADNYVDCNQNLTCYCGGTGSNLNCVGVYYCGLIPEPPGLTPTNATSNATNTTSTATSEVTTLLPTADVNFVGIQVEVILGILGVVFLIICVFLICLSVCFCYYCCIKSKRCRIHV